MHIVQTKGSPIVLSLLYREVSGDNPDEQASIKGSLILMNILLEKCETLQARFDMETHLIGMGILRTTKVIITTILGNHIIPSKTKKRNNS
jgi:hypothetical protein